MCVPLRVETNQISNNAMFVAPGTRRTERSLRKMAVVAAAACALLVLGLAAVGAKTVFSSIGNAGDLRAVSAPISGALEASVGSISRSEGYITMAGTVVNPLNRTTPTVNAVLEILDKSGKTIAVEESVIAYRSLHASESSPFTIMTPDVKEAAQYRLSFRRPDGAMIE